MYCDTCGSPVATSVERHVQQGEVIRSVSWGCTRCGSTGVEEQSLGRVVREKDKPVRGPHPQARF